MLYLAVATDTFHALLMMVWIAGLPFLFWRRWPKISFTYAAFSLAFIIVNQISHYTLGECVFTTIADWFYSRAGQAAPSEWFTVRLSKIVFGFIPSHRGISILTEILIGISAIGGIFLFFKRKTNARRQKA